MKYKAYWEDDEHSIVRAGLRGKTACVVKDNGNGLTIKFPSHSCVEQDIFMSLDYSQASFLKECLNQWKDD